METSVKSDKEVFKKIRKKLNIHIEKEKILKEELEFFTSFSEKTCEKLIVSVIIFDKSREGKMENFEKLKGKHLVYLKENISKDTLKEFKLDSEDEDQLIETKQEIYQEVNIVVKNKNKLTYEQAFSTISDTYVKYYNDYGTFFRHTHRIIKYINENIEDRELSSNLLGILRANYSEKMLLAIMYNSMFTPAGMGLGVQLQQLNFFGDQEDINKNNMHFNNEKCVFPIVDEQVFELSLLEKIFICNNKIAKVKTEEELKVSIEKQYNNFYGLTKKT